MSVIKNSSTQLKPDIANLSSFELAKVPCVDWEKCGTCLINQEENRVLCDIPPLFVQRKQVLIGQETSKSHTGINKHHKDAAPTINTPVGLFSKNHNFCQKISTKNTQTPYETNSEKRELIPHQDLLAGMGKNSYPAELKERGSRHDWIEGLGSVGYNSDHCI